MTQSFGIVEDKLFEAEFFLDRLRTSSRFSYGSRYYFSAFISASRSVTLALQTTMKDVEGFKEWYQEAQSNLKANALARFFVEIRNDSIHKGLNPLNQVSIDHLREDMFHQLHHRDRSHVLILPNLQNDSTMLTDAVHVSTIYFVSLINVIFECYSEFRHVVDPQWYFTHENFLAMGKSFEDAVLELGFPPEWASYAPIEGDKWRILRLQQPSCQVNGLFQKYIGRIIASPDDL